MAKNKNKKVSTLIENLKRLLNYKIPKWLYFVIFIFHIPFLLFIILFINLFLKSNDIWNFILLFIYIGILLPILVFLKHISIFNINFGNIPMFNFEGAKGLPIIIPFYFVVYLIWYYFKRNKETTIGYLLLSVFITWLSIVILSIIFFRTELGE